MGFCDKKQYERFMVQVPEFEHMLYEDGVVVIKFWFSISKEEQKRRFQSRLQNPLKVWKFSPVDIPWTISGMTSQLNKGDLEDISKEIPTDGQ